MITEEQAREAAERLRAAAVAFKDCEDDDPRLTEIEWAIEGNEQMLVTFAREELSRRDAERAERALPITAEWCVENGATFELGWMRFYCKEAVVSWCESSVWVSHKEGQLNLRKITTRGQLLDLLNALRGGGA